MFIHFFSSIFLTCNWMDSSMSMSSSSVLDSALYLMCLRHIIQPVNTSATTVSTAMIRMKNIRPSRVNGKRYGLLLLLTGSTLISQEDPP